MQAPKRMRGRTTCAKLAKKDLRIKFNKHGNPKGKMLSQYTSYVAVLSKERFPITVKDWKQVDKKLKLDAWEEIKQTWGIKNDKGQSHTIKKMNSAWKNFKSDLVNDFMRVGRNPTLVYTWMKPEVWAEFVRQKSTPEFQKRKQQEVDSGEFVPSGSNDVLMAILGNPEHSGRTRDLGALVTWKQGLNTPRASRKRVAKTTNIEAFAEEVRAQCRAKMKVEMQDIIAQLRSELLAELQVTHIAPNQNSPGLRRSSHMSNEICSPLDSIEKASPCHPIVQVGIEHVKITNATVWPKTPDNNCHNVPILEDHMKVQVDYADEIYHKFPLPVKQGDFAVIADCFGSFIQWPKSHIILDESSSEDASMPDMARNEEAESSHRASLVFAKRLAKLGPLFQTLHNRMMGEPGKNAFIVPILEGLLQPKSTLINLGFNDLVDLMKQDKLDMSIISIWILYLKRLLTDLGREGVVGFLDPSMISQTLFERDNVSTSHYLLESLTSIQDKRFILAPYIQNQHWVLLIFVPRDNRVYVIDSLAPTVPKYVIMWFFKDVFKDYAEAGGVHNGSTTECEWLFIESPRQVGHKVCGFFVMKHMLDLCTTQFDTFPDCHLPEKRYTPADLYRIQLTWCQFFLENC